MLPQDSFVFGKDFSPEWFICLTKKGKVEWINECGRIKGCYCTNKTGVTLAKMIGDIISANEFFSSNEEMLAYCKEGDLNE